AGHRPGGHPAVTENHRKVNALRELEKAHRAMRAAQALAGLGLWDDAVSRAYYAAFHAASAVLFSAGLQARSHAGTHDLLFEHFVQTGTLGRSVTKDFAALQRYREQADYSTAVQFDEASGREEVERAERLVAELTKVLRTRGMVE